jgi:hypothetical protein
MISKTHLPILAALMARSNMGQGYAAIDRIANLLEGDHQWSVNECVENLCGEFSETVKDEDGKYVDTLDYFYEEAKAWADRLAMLEWDDFKESYETGSAAFIAAQDTLGGTPE